MSKSKKLKVLKYSIIILVLLVITYVVGFGIIPYMSYKEVNNNNIKDSFNIQDFYAEEGMLSIDRVMLVEADEAGFDMRIRAIENAKQKIDISCHMIEEGNSTDRIFASLLEAANRGIKVRIIIDGVNKNKLKAETVYALIDNSNIEFKIYNPINILYPWTYNPRMHDKIFIVDNEVLIFGSRNMGDRYYADKDFAKELTLDREVLIYNSGYKDKNNTDSIIYTVEKYFEDIWSLEVCKNADECYMKPSIKNIKNKLDNMNEKYIILKDKRPELFESVKYEEITVGINKVMFISNPIEAEKKEPVLWYKIYKLLENANERVIIQTPYTIVNDEMRNMLKQLNTKVKAIKLITNSPGTTPNIPGFSGYLADRKNLINTGIKIFEYQGENSVHCKSFLVDDDISIIGSFNLDIRSTYLDTESMLIIQGKDFQDELEEKVNSYQKCSLEIGYDNKYINNAEISEKQCNFFKRTILTVSPYVFNLVRFLL